MIYGTVCKFIFSSTGIEFHVRTLRNNTSNIYSSSFVRDVVKAVGAAHCSGGKLKPIWCCKMILG